MLDLLKCLDLSSITLEEAEQQLRAEQKIGTERVTDTWVGTSLMTLHNTLQGTWTQAAQPGGSSLVAADVALKPEVLDIEAGDEVVKNVEDVALYQYVC